MACDPGRVDLSGLGRRVLGAWLAEAAARDQDAVAEVSPLEGASDVTAARTRRRRRLFFQRNGFHLFDEVAYALPSGAAMSLAIRPRPARPRFDVRELSEIAAMVAWVAGPECSFTTGFVFDLSGGRATY